jgi:TonB family protein
MPGLTLLGLTLASAAAGAEPGPALGEMLDMDGRNYLPQVGLTLHQPDGPEPGLYRRIALNWQEHPLQAGAYPAEAFAARLEGEVGLSLTIEPDGRLSDCTVTAPSGVAALDAHACPHLLSRTAFHPGLDESGGRFGGTVAATLRYRLRLGVEMPAGPGGASDTGPATPAAPLDPVTLATLGIARGMRPPPTVGGISATLLVEADGRVGACLVSSPSYVDAIDRGACDRLRRDVRFRPARDAGGQAVASRYTVSLSWRR